MLILLSSCGALIRFLYNSSRPQIIVQQITHYVPLPTEIPAQDENLGVRNNCYIIVIISILLYF